MDDKFKNNIKIIFEYKNRNFTSEIAPYEKISSLEPLAKRLIFNLKKGDKTKEEISLTYHNQDLETINNLLIGDYFSKNKIIKIQIVPKIIKKARTYTDKSIDFNDPIMKSLSCTCGKFLINNYCRNDKIFICNNCKNKYHKNHKSIKVNINNLSEGVINYGLSIQKEIKINLSDSKKYFDKFNNQNFTDANSRQERIKKKYDSLNELYNSIMEKLDFNDMDENKMNEYLQESKKYNNEINNILNHVNYNSQNSNYKMTIDEFKQYFNKLSQKDKVISNISANTNIYRIKYEINEKIHSINNQIENIIDNALKLKNPFGISDESMEIYKSILQESKNENGNENYNENNDDNNYRPNEYEDDIEYNDDE